MFRIFFLLEQNILHRYLADLQLFLQVNKKIIKDSYNKTLVKLP